MLSAAELAHERNARMIAVTDAARGRALRLWSQVDFRNLDQSWSQVGPSITAQAVGAQSVLARGSDSFTNQLSGAYGFSADKSSTIPQSFAGLDGEGRNVAGLMYGSITTTKRTIGAGFGSAESMQAGATYLAAMMKTVISDIARAADKVSAAGKGYTRYVRVVNGSACSRCAILAGISSSENAFLRHVSCQCSAVAIPHEGKAPKGLHDSPDSLFQSLSVAEQDRIFTKAGAEAIREGSEVTNVVNARRGARGIGYSSHGGTKANTLTHGVFTKSTIGYRPNGEPIRVYTTLEGATVRGNFGRRNLVNAQAAARAGSRVSSFGRVRLMPESIFEMAGQDTTLRQAFLRDAGYLNPSPGTGAQIVAQQRADRILVDRATLKFSNFTLG